MGKLGLLAVTVAVGVSGLCADAQTADFERGHEAAVARQVEKVRVEDRRGAFAANWESLGKYETPEWFRDAKFGIFVHWGVYSVPAYGNEWYPRNMYLEGNAANVHHVATYGPLTKFGYKDFIPMFRAEKFDAKAWVDLFARAGAKYVVPVAEHCDGFAMYDSSLSEWTAAKMGPHRDVVGEMEKAVRARGLRFGVSSHRAEHWWWYGGGMRQASDVQDATYAPLYGPAAPMGLPGTDARKEPNAEHLEKWFPPSQQFLDDWLARSTELVDKYHPDFFYFDWWIGQPAFKPGLQDFAAYFYDRAVERKQKVVLTYKQESMPANVATLDIERGKMDELRLLPWQTDTSVSVHSWGYVKGDEYRDAGSLIQELVDVVSKNGNLLLNVGPKADGTIPEEAQKVLLQMGDWLRANGEAIYGTRPWVMYGEGPTLVKDGLKINSDNQRYTADDLRFTAKGDAVYAIALGWPAGGEMVIRVLGKGLPYLKGDVCGVSLLGSAAKVGFEQRVDGLHLMLPAVHADEAAYVFRVRAGGECSR
ncbi:MAG: alpha-L-fucosidase [Acidobacteriota bacterium]